MSENIFAKAQKEREEAQAQIKNNCGLATSTIPKNRHKVRLDLTVPAATKERLMKYAAAQGLSASVVVQMLINEHCPQ